MRLSLVSALLGLSLAACTGTIGEDGGGGGGGRGPDAASAVPRLDAAVDKPTITTELSTTTMVTVTLEGSGGFSGPVSLTASVVDPASTPMNGWTVTLDTSNVTIDANGTASVVATMTIPSVNRGLAATLKIDATSSLGTVNMTSAVTVQNQVTLPVRFNGNCQYPGNVSVRAGTKVRFLNAGGPNDELIIHTNGDANGIPHGDNGTAITQGLAYETTATGTSGTVDWYCHSPGPDLGGNNPKITIVP